MPGASCVLEEFTLKTIRHTTVGLWIASASRLFGKFISWVLARVQVVK